MPRDRLNPDTASRSVVDVERQLVADAAECLSLGQQTRRARPKSFLRRPPRARRRPSEPSCYGNIWRAQRLCDPRSYDITAHLTTISLGLLGSRVPSTTYNVGRQALIEALQRLASDEGEEPEARQHGYGQLDTRPQHPDRSRSSRWLSRGSGRRRSLT